MKRLKVLWMRVREFNVPLYASHAGFFMALSVFPMLVLTVNLLKFVGLGAEELTEMLHGVLPTALMPGAQKLIFSTYAGSDIGSLSFSAVAVLWSASRGIHGLRTGLNRIYGVEEDRGWLATRLVSILYTVAFLLVLLLTLVLHLFGTAFLQLPFLRESGLFRLLENVVDLRFFLLLGLQAALFTALFAFLPGGRRRLSESFPGAVLAAFGWLVFSYGYSIYVEHFANSRNLYGSVYAVALSLLWLYFCLCILFYGGALNRYLQEKK